MGKRILVISFPEYGKKLINYFNSFLNEDAVDCFSLERSFFDDEPIIEHQKIEDLFRSISIKIEKFLSEKPIRPIIFFTVQVSLPSPNKTSVFDVWDPLLIYPDERKRPYPKAVLLSWLILAYPEVHWFFISEYTQDREENKSHLTNEVPLKGFKKYFSSVFEPLFDPLNLRNSIRFILTNKKETSYIPYRIFVSSAIDEEDPYAYLHGYLAYRLMHRSFLVTTEREMKTLFEEKANPLPFEIKMVFEDMFLNFPDRTKEKLSYLEIRDNQFARLKNVNSRIFVTVGHKYNTDRYYKNKNYIQKLISEGKEIRVVYKPSGGMYNILDKSGLLKEYWEKCKEEWRKAKPKQNEEEPGGHSAPGRLLVIAEKLINRGEKIFDEAKAVQDCIHGATLALEAQELLGYRTPTTSLEAIALRHKLEVKAECMFYGMEHNIDVKNRIEEIEKEVDVVAQWFNPRVKKRAALNAKMGIITEVMRIFKNYGQFDEEEECLNYFRGLNRRWSLMQPGFKGTFFWIIFPIRWYVEKLVGSLPLFILALISWPALLGIFSAWTRAKFFVNEEFKFRFWDHVMDSFSTFFGLQPGNFPTNAQGKILTIILIFLGFIHLGIFISHLYTLITRR